MDIAIEAKRRSEAINRIAISAGTIGGELGLTDLSAAVLAASHRNPAYQQLFQLEAVADLLEAVAGAIATKEEPIAPSITPAAAAFAEDNGIDVSTITGTGKDGTITKGDVEAALAAKDSD